MIIYKNRSAALSRTERQMKLQMKIVQELFTKYKILQLYYKQMFLIKFCKLKFEFELVKF